jgi:glutamyl-tRNA reductase
MRKEFNQSMDDTGIRRSLIDQMTGIARSELSRRKSKLGAMKPEHERVLNELLNSTILKISGSLTELARRLQNEARLDVARLFDQT